MTAITRAFDLVAALAVLADWGVAPTPRTTPISGEAALLGSAMTLQLERDAGEAARQADLCERAGHCPGAYPGR